MNLIKSEMNNWRCSIFYTTTDDRTTTAYFYMLIGEAKEIC